MGEYSVFKTDTFMELYSSLEKDEQEWIDKIKGQLEEYPTGKPLHFKWFREKKYLNKRLYFLVDEENKKILFVSFASKKEQQSVINFIIENKKEFLAYLRNI